MNNLNADYKKICPVTNSLYKKSFFSKTCVLDNSMWGIQAIRRDSNVKGVYYEHGFYINGVVLEGQMSKNIKKIYTLNPARVSFLKSLLNVDVFLTTPYIVDMPECIITKKNMLNIRDSKKITLYIGNHSTTRFKEDVKKFSKKGSFTLNLRFYLDMKDVQGEDFCYICCGNRYDPFFLSRLKSLILYSDELITDCYGTHIVYAASLGRKFAKTEFFENKERIKRQALLYKIKHKTLGHLLENDITYFESLLESKI